MCITEYIKERAQELERSAQGKIEIVDFLIAGTVKAQNAAANLPRASGLLALLLGMHAELAKEKAAASCVIKSALELQRATTEIKL